LERSKKGWKDQKREKTLKINRVRKTTVGKDASNLEAQRGNAKRGLKGDQNGVWEKNGEGKIRNGMCGGGMALRRKGNSKREMGKVSSGKKNQRGEVTRKMDEWSGQKGGPKKTAVRGGGTHAH